MSDKLTVHVQKATDGSDYVQIMSADQTSINIVLIADEIELKDSRPDKPPTHDSGMYPGLDS